MQLAIALWSAAPLHSGYENHLKKQQLSECTILSLIARGIFAPLHPGDHPVDGWTIAFQANGPQGAWTTLWTSSAYATPIGMPANTMVVTAGGYTFKDYAKAGVPLILVSTVVSMILLPIFYPFFP